MIENVLKKELTNLHIFLELEKKLLFFLEGGEV